MKKILLYLAIIFFAYSCGSKRVIYNNQNDIPKKEKKLKRSKQKSKKVKKIFLAPRISNIEDYVKVYSEIAMDEMIQFGIPASITLSQGILESGIGKGRLAVEANNHFGIKCHDWNGKKFITMMMRNKSVLENMIILSIPTETILYSYPIGVDILFCLILKETTTNNGQKVLKKQDTLPIQNILRN